jgi:hypothetical protein
VTQLRAAYNSLAGDVDTAKNALAELKAFQASQAKTNADIATLHAGYDKLAAWYDTQGKRLVTNIRAASGDLEGLKQFKTQATSGMRAFEDAHNEVKVVAGPAGPVGPQGPPGPPGPPGRDAANGGMGKDGLDGKSGAQGPAGAPGLEGPAGLDGRNGLDGKDGRDGAVGPAGPAGPDGAHGLAGADGKAGKWHHKSRE